ncbi:MAG: hypothetical protein ACRC7S_04085 [Cetobacterium sp.]
MITIFKKELYEDLKEVIKEKKDYDEQQQFRARKELEENLLAGFEYEESLENFLKLEKIKSEQQPKKWFDRFGGRNVRRRNIRNFIKPRK